MITSAVFLDRDGVLNEMPLNPLTQKNESPHRVEDLHIYPEVVPALRDLQKKFKLFVVSNQPSYAKGKVSLEVLNQIAEKFSLELSGQKINIEKYYYCYHHPESIVPELKKNCECRKPGSLFLKNASKDYQVDLKSSWMIGDRDSDVQCGQSVGCRTILIENPVSKEYQGKTSPTAKVKNMTEAANFILSKGGQ